MKIQDITSFLESIAPLHLQEKYDNAGLITGSAEWECSGVITTLDATEEVVKEAIAKKCNLIVAHHPIVFGGLKKITGKNYVEKTVIAAIKNDIAIYAIHTNLDNVIEGVSGKIAEKIGLTDVSILQPSTGYLCKLICFVPLAHIEAVRSAIFAAGGGNIGNYSECSFSAAGEGTFRANDKANPYVGDKDIRHTEQEYKVEVIVPAWILGAVIAAMIKAHPYEEVAYDVIPLQNTHAGLGAGVIGTLAQPVKTEDFLQRLKDVFGLQVIRHTAKVKNEVQKIAICGGAGAFLTGKALAAGADVYVTGDVKYHEFFDAEGRMMIADIGHFESEQFTIDLLFDVLREKFPTFAVLKTAINTNPVHYFR